MAGAEEKIEEQAEQEVTFDSKSSKKGIYLAIVVVQILIAAFLIWKFVFPEYQQLTETEQVLNDSAQKEEEQSESDEPHEIGVMYKIDNLTVNPKGTRGMRFAVFEFSLELPDAGDIQTLDKYKTVLIDNYIKYFRNCSVAELSKNTMTDTLKQNLMKITNEVVGKQVVENVYFTQFVLE